MVGLVDRRLYLTEISTPVDMKNKKSLSGSRGSRGLTVEKNPPSVGQKHVNDVTHGTPRTANPREEGRAKRPGIEYFDDKNAVEV